MPSTATSTLLSAGPVLFAPELSSDGAAVLFAADVARAAILAFELPTETPAGEQSSALKRPMPSFGE